ncbi:MAG: hypothetical protein ACKVVP_16570 [Chloroflexota bacterium]
MCGLALGGEQHVAEPAGIVQHRWIYLDLFDLKMPAHMQTIDDRSEVVSHMYERFAPFADEGWEWVTHPSSYKYDGWVYQESVGLLKLAGANLLCQRTLTPDLIRAVDPQHHVPQYRTRQLIQRLYTLEKGTGQGPAKSQPS